MTALTFIITYRKQILYTIAAAAVAFLLYWYGYHIPSKLKAVEADNKHLAEQVEAGQKAITLLEDINKGKVKIDEQTFKNISAIRAKIGKPHTVLVPAGRLLLPAMPKTNSAY